MRRCFPILLSLAASGCVAEPALADAFPPGHRLPPLAAQIEELPPGDLLGYQPAPVPPIPGGAASDRLFDPPVTGGGSISGPTLLASWRGAPADWAPPGLSGQGLGSRAGGNNNGNNNGNNQQNGGNGNGNNGCGNGNGGPSGGKDCGGGKPPQPPISQPGVPGPIGIAGVAMAWRQARKIRQRVKG